MKEDVKKDVKKDVKEEVKKDLKNIGKITDKRRNSWQTEFSSNNRPCDYSTRSNEHYYFYLDY